MASRREFELEIVQFNSYIGNSEHTGIGNE